MPYMNYKITQVNTKYGAIVKAVVFVFIFINSLNFKIRPDLTISNNDIESFSAEIVSDKIRHTIFNVLKRPPNGQIEPLLTFLNYTFSQIKVSNKAFHIAGVFNLNLPDHDTNKKVKNFLNLVYQNGMIPIINKSIIVTRKIATAVNHILSNCFTETVFKIVIFKSDISDNAPICFLVLSSSTQRENKTIFIYNRILNTESIESFRKKSYKTDWEKTETSKIPDETYATSLQKFIVLYDNYFLKKG